MKTTNKRKAQPEFELQKQIAAYLDWQYPDAMYLSDTIASVKLTIPQQLRNKEIQKSDFKCPDLLILEPKGEYKGLLIELKVESPYKKDGNLKKDKHLEAQETTIRRLNLKGYYATFCWGFEMTKKTIDWYMGLNGTQ